MYRVQRETLPEAIERVVRGWSQWSRHEQEHMDAIVEEVLDHCRNGTGNNFIRNFVNAYVVPQLEGRLLVR